MGTEATGMDRKQAKLSPCLSLGSLLAKEGDDTLIGLTGEEERQGKIYTLLSSKLKVILYSHGFAVI